MWFYNQSKKFDPLSGKVPYRSIKGLPSIAERARALLGSRDSKQIYSVAEFTDWLLEDNFRLLKNQAVLSLKAKIGEDEFNRCYEWIDGICDDGYWIEKETEEYDLGIPRPHNTNEVDALKLCQHRWGEIDAPDYPNVKPYEAFAILSLCFVEDAIDQFQRSSINSDFESLSLALHTMLDGIDTQVSEASIKSGLPTDIYLPVYLNYNVNCAIASAMSAMDAVCYAESLHEITNLQNEHTLNIAKAQEDINNNEAEQRSHRQRKLNIARHRKTNEAKSKAIQEWEKDKSKFISAAKYGRYLSEWLKEQNYLYEPGTVTDWIRTHAKQIGVRLR
ncbi:MAG: hypothetical protein DID91_2727703884 [Candidatus Nitrotoga sp. MKT]|nr:MAG: hypothetical protein DID91_2727703884 [Candidatus Nitrotoga sp. MKT]